VTGRPDVPDGRDQGSLILVRSDADRKAVADALEAFDPEPWPSWLAPEPEWLRGSRHQEEAPDD